MPSPITPEALRRLGSFAAGSMGPKVSPPSCHLLASQMQKTVRALRAPTDFICTVLYTCRYGYRAILLDVRDGQV